MSSPLIAIGIRILVFAAVFALATRRHPGISVRPRLALPLVGLVFALLNTGLYWLLKPVLSLATFGAAALLAPLAVNAVLLWATGRLLRPLRIGGWRPMLYLAVLLTLAHGALHLAFQMASA